MLFKKSAAWLFALLVVTGCASVGDLQATCEAQTHTFPQMVDCLKKQVAEDSRMTNKPEIKLYMLKAEQLSNRVKQKAISELDAKVELQQMYVQFKQQETSNAMAAYAARPRMKSCYPVGNTVQCNSY